MNTTKSIEIEAGNDAELVGECLTGNRDAFRQIVERYQTLISSLAYSATGDVSQSEDLAQETFVSAWKQLAQLREPAKLRPWLCSIARFLISKEFRRRGRQPACAAESLEPVNEWVSPEPLPPDHAISDEEKALLWRSLERIPQIYREPLVLFYREHQSIEAVAKDLELSEDAVKQRLSRGRKLLQEQFLSFVAGALKQTSPGKIFTIGVMAALPLFATTAKAAAASTTAAKGGAMAKATGLGAIFQALLKAVSGFIGALSPILLLGGYFGFKMGGDARQSSQQRESVATFWRIVVGCLGAFVALPILTFIFLMFIHKDNSGDFRVKLLHEITIWLGLMYAVVPAALILWAWQRRGKLKSQTVAMADATAGTGKKRWLVIWVVIAMIGTGTVLGLGLLDTNWNIQRVTAKEIQKMVADGKGKAASFSVLQYRNGYGYFFITLRENGKKSKILAPLDDATLALVKAQGIKCPTYVQGRDFEVFGWPGRLLPAFCVFILAIGGVVLLRRPGKCYGQAMDEQQSRKMQRVERAVNKVFGAGVALLLIAVAILLSLLTRWHIHTISDTEAQQIIATSTVVRCEVVQYHGGKRELWLTSKGSRHYPEFVAPVDEATLALLREKKIEYRTVIQGRDFGFADPKPSVSLVWISVLTASAFVLLRWVVKKNKAITIPPSIPRLTKKTRCLSSACSRRVN